MGTKLELIFTSLLLLAGATQAGEQEPLATESTPWGAYVETDSGNDANPYQQAALACGDQEPVALQACITRYLEGE
ncbi:MAG: hypothetical protein PHE17_07570 [Thiothrix sp.]|uniref:hypothetical protein n=1 Tax=Thiothrix sp. TaxID=1032 RepID=UPI002628ACD0|nr:hypothetical protein [Thiothrix sp.]MDD5392864.1 hypothetical protein [Thiothrix sp.]